jgi:c-di-GMP-binding flagellar brake protein YcgR
MSGSAPTSQIPQTEIAERRRSMRYPVNAEVEYRILSPRETGSPCRGRLVDLSNTGLMLQSNTELEAGLEIELTIQWPARQAGLSGFGLHAIGRTVRVKKGLAALRIDLSSFGFGSESERKT